ncbi:hypothetical protein CP97_03700 [Aurantiacibacter atlanticus]|uniref:2-amino-4-hydroxy-6-hydroxymethyldihydropteridine pyrophosphokinase n=1 Tax=Aurantiacibacter atlanticus TaxID=1648404 RepID=A0A0H4VES3_9SPHN|nr:2-amino-4-hydroxy-6-hydroxymethyldihydropteridine diphosphokinase [Aurantiacibacter atlanticus]AKQ41336.1 hypothetical protein CP97_03700 [Aurantiacibacter atlanticus]MDF1834631.1 2-amino-4-hydroxy-6-hydroxymethyldihydropteridine diphosphokinase [Alteraurantiacibacter sp. bin_em_oilr2.035]
MGKHGYIIALGSNQRHPGYGRPPQILRAAAIVIAEQIGEVRALSPVITSAPVGPSQRRYANGALVLETDLAPLDLLAGLHVIEAHFGRKRRGQPWRSRPLDCDIVLWSGGIYAAPDLAIPHPQFRTRDFVLGPAAAIAPCWRDPLTGLTIRQLACRLAKPQGVDR